MRALFVVVPSPSGDLLVGEVQAGEPVLVEAFIPETPVEALDVGVLRGLARLDELEVGAALIVSPVQRLPLNGRAPARLRRRTADPTSK